MKITLLKGISVDIDAVPDNLEEIIQQSFTEYTCGTREEYTFEDKLMFIDMTVQKLHKATDANMIANKLCFDFFEYELSETCHLPDPDEFIEAGFLSACVEAGQKNQRLYSFEYSQSRRDCEKIMKILERVITAVMLWKPEAESDESAEE